MRTKSHIQEYSVLLNSMLTQRGFTSMAEMFANFTICKAADGGIDAVSGIGTGGYVLKEYEPGIGANLERNPNYWRDDRAHAATVEILTIADATARNSVLLSDAVDVIDEIEFKIVDRLKAEEGITVEKTQGPLHYLFSMMSGRDPFKSNDVRLAMKYACNREEMIAKVLSGHGTLANDHPIGPSYFYHDAGLEQRPYDPDKARFHLKKAGLDSLTLDVSAGTAAFGGAVDAATILQESVRPAGIDVTLIREPADGYWTNVYMQKPIFTNYWGGYTRASDHTVNHSETFVRAIIFHTNFAESYHSLLKRSIMGWTPTITLV